MTDDEVGYDGADNQNIDYPFEEVGTGGDENRIRGNWSSRTDYFLSVFGYMFALGNLWRFPHQLIAHGGAAYLVPYAVIFGVVALPIVFMELALGQFISLGPVAIWNMAPLFKGIGISMVFISIILSVYYNMITAWALLYVVNSMKFVIPWASCGNTWNTENCSTWNREMAEACQTIHGRMLVNGTCLITATETSTLATTTATTTANSTIVANMTAVFVSTMTAAPAPATPSPTAPPLANRTLPSLEYFHNQVLMLSAGPLEFLTINWQLAICLFVAWLFVFVCSFRGVKTSGKVVYFTVIMPYIILVVLSVRLLTLPGSLNGIQHFFWPNWSVLRNFRVWGDAAIQVFYSLSMCTGGLTTLASYNRFHSNVFFDVWLFGIVDFVTSIAVSALIFSSVGFVCYEIGVPLYQFQVQEGFQLIFVFFAEALAKIPVAQLYSLLFFGMVALVVFNSELFIVQTIVSSICDEFPERLRRNDRHVLIFTLFGVYLVGLSLCSSAGVYWILFLERFTATWSLIIIAFFEMMVVCWIYGADNFMDNIKWMVRFYPPAYIIWRILWKLICPISLLGLLAFIWIEYVPLTYNFVTYPQWMIALGWTISFSPMLFILCTGVYKFCTMRNGWTKGWRELLCPRDDWGPALAVHRAEVYPMQIPEARKLVQMRPQYSQDFVNGGAPPRVDGPAIGGGLGNGNVISRYGAYKNPAYEANGCGGIFGSLRGAKFNGTSSKYTLAATSDRETII